MSTSVARSAAAPGIRVSGSTPRNQLRQSFRARDGVALIVSNVIGVGIFTTPAIVAQLVPHPGAMLGVWLTGGVLALAGALSYAQLGRRWPAAGGEYIYLSNAYGPAAGFLSGWTSLIAGFSGAVAACAVALVIYLGQYFPALALERALVSIPLGLGSVAFSPRSLTAAAFIVAFAALHACNLGAGKLTQNALALLVLAITVGFCVAGFAVGHGSWSHLHESYGAFTAKNWLLALIPVMFTYSGWNAASYISEEIYDTRRNIGRALLTGTAVIVAVYAILNTLYLYAVPLKAMQGAVNVGDITAQALFGVGRNFVTPVLILTLLGAISAMTIAGPRVYFAMARDGVFLRSFGRTSPRFGTPGLAIVLQACWSVGLVLVGGFNAILMYTGFMLMLSSGAAVLGLFVARRNELRATPSLWVKMIAPALFVIAAAAIVVNGVMQAPKTSLIGVALIVAGLPVFFWSRRSWGSQLAVQAQPAAPELK